MNILIADVADWELPTLKKRLKKHKVTYLAESLTERNVAAAKKAEVLCIFVSSKITFKVIKAMPKLKLIVVRATGFDNIDLNECKRRKITVCNVPSYGDFTVAEYTFALILALSRKIVFAVEKTKKGDFCLDGLRGFDLKGKTIGVIGTGKIGKNVIRIANGFGMNVLAFDKFPDHKFEKEEKFKYAALDKLLSGSDIITLHTPLTKATCHIINKNNIKKIKKGALLINSARGGLIETEALVKALKDKLLLGAALDVLEDECMKEEAEQILLGSKDHNFKTLVEQHLLLEMDNVIVTPHNAFNSDEAVNRLLNTAIDNILSFVNKKPINVLS